MPIDAKPASLRLHAFEPASRANGPGVRAVLWTQGCTLACPGCFNPETHTPDAGADVAIETLLERVLALGDAIEGITVSGGEPLQQRAPLLAFLRELRYASDLSVILFSGFRAAEVAALPEAHGRCAKWSMS